MDDKLSDRLRIETYNGVHYIFVDYTGLKEKEMIELITRHKGLAVETRLPFLADFHKTYATPGYMKHAREFVTVTKSIVDTGALLGVDFLKSFLLKSILLLHRVNYRSFGSREEALEFLVKSSQIKFEKHDVFELVDDLNPKIVKGMKGVILEVPDENLFLVEFLGDVGKNIEYKGEFTFLVKKEMIRKVPE